MVTDILKILFMAVLFVSAMIFGGIALMRLLGF